MKFINKRDIKSFLAVSSLFLIFLFINYIYNYTILKHSISRYEQGVFDRVKLKVDDWTKSNFIDVQKLARTIEEEDLQDREALKEFMFRLQKNSNFPYIILGLKTGEFFISDKDFVTPYNYTPTKRDWFNDTLEANKTIATKPYFSMRLGLRSVSICTPISVFGTSGVFCGGQPFKFISDYFAQYRSLYDKNLFLMDEGTEILGKISQNQNVSFEDKNYIKFPVDNTKWFIVFEKNSEIYESSLSEFFIINLIFYAFFVFIYFFTNMFWFKENKKSNKQLEEQNNFIKDALTKKNSSVLVSCDEEFNIISKEIDSFYDIFDGINLKQNILNSSYIVQDEKSKFIQSDEQYLNLTINNKSYLLTKTVIDGSINFLFQDISYDKIKTDYDGTIDRVLLFVRNNLNDDSLCVDKLATVSGYSKFHFQRMFKNYTGQTLANYLRNLRLNRAKFLLSFSDENISNIAYDCGFSHIESFSRAFSKEFGSSPSAFRDEFRKIIIKEELIYEEVFISSLKLSITFSQNNTQFLNGKKYFIIEYSNLIYASNDENRPDISISDCKFIKVDFIRTHLNLETILNKIYTVFYDYKTYNHELPIAFYTKNELNQIDFIYINLP
ncbi:helix-turn-helix domain-containing protein [Campylobacter fetus]|uniref:helix-turn-helix domain-containing protein n=1 Tax=Campylobacter fetus TaxID=196 RepID=UPI0008187B1C|nr:helix-turn-helix domain-containing protein [Campylobacter fetus]